MPAVTDRVAIVRACREIMRDSEALFLTSLEEGGAPSTRAVFNLRRESQFPALRDVFLGADDPPLVYVATNTASEKLRQIRADPRVSLYYCVPRTFHGVMLSARAAEVVDQAVKDRLWQPGWEIYFPTGRLDPDYTVLEFPASKARGWLCGQSFEVRFAVAP